GEPRVPLREGQVVRLHDERRLREGPVVPRVVEVEVAVHDDRDLVRPHADGGEARDDRVLGAHDDRERALWAVRRVGTFDVHRMEPRVEEHEAFVGPQEARPHRDAHDLGAAVGEEGRTREIDEPRAQQRELEQAASVRSREAWRSGAAVCGRAPRPDPRRAGRPGEPARSRPLIVSAGLGTALTGAPAVYRLALILLLAMPAGTFAYVVARIQR